MKKNLFLLLGLISVLFLSSCSFTLPSSSYKSSWWGVETIENGGYYYKLNKTPAEYTQFLGTYVYMYDTDLNHVRNVFPNNDWRGAILQFLDERKFDIKTVDYAGPYIIVHGMF